MKHRIFSILLFLSLLPTPGSAQSMFIKDWKQQTIAFNQQEYTLIQGYFEVPEDRSKPQGNILRLPIRIYKTNNPFPSEPIFWLNGGPGASNIFSLSFDDFLKNHDVVIIGYRGADGNSVFHSKRVGKAMQGQRHQLLSDKSLNNASKTFKKYLARLEHKGIDLDKYTVMDVIEDIEYVRRSMEVPQLHFYSASYGTRVALLYSYKYPQHVGRTIMTGANPPGHFLWYPEKTEQILCTYDSLYRAGQGSGYQGSIREAMQVSFERMPKRWAGFRLDADKIKCMTFGLLFSVDGAVMVFDAYFRAANKRDYSGLYLLQLFFDIGMRKTSAWGDTYTKGLSADLEQGKPYRTWLRSMGENTTLGANYSLLLWGVAEDWNTATIPEEYRKLRMSDTPTLVLSGNLDVSTPADYATTELMPSLRKGHQVILKDYSHAITGNYQKQEIRNMMTRFFDTGVVDTTGIRYQPIDFKPKKSLHKLAKRGYPLWVVMSWLY
jgi:pimeloyl-ACP methyl ester carboxylesterase